jgi:hypothetical protein
MQEGITTTMDTRGATARTDPTSPAAAAWQTAVRLASQGMRLAAAGAVSAWRSLVLREPKAAATPEIAQALDIEALSAQLAVEQRGEADGRAGRPSENEASPSGTQKEIIHYFSELHRQAQHKVALAAESLREAGGQLGLPEAIGVLRDIPSRVEKQIRRRAADHLQHLAFLQEREARHAEDYTNFRKTHQLQRAAEYPGSRWLFFVLAAVLAAACVFGVPSVAPAEAQAAFALTLENAPLLAVLALTVLVSYGIGAGLLRSINHISFGEQMIGWLGGVLGVVLIAAVALFTSHYVVALGAGAADPVLTAIDAVITAPVAFGGVVAAWAVAAVIAVSALVAMLLGYASDDAYPGYGAVQRAFYASQKELESFTRRRRGQISAIVDRAEREVEDIAGRAKKRLRQYVRLTDSLRRLPAALGNYASALEDACNILLERYRAANMRARKTPAPASFAELFCFGPDQDLTSELLTEESARLGQLQQWTEKLEEQVAATRQLIRDSDSRAIGDLAMASGEEQRY